MRARPVTRKKQALEASPAHVKRMGAIVAALDDAISGPARLHCSRQPFSNLVFLTSLVICA
jgi:hypothetical protein